MSETVKKSRRPMVVETKRWGKLEIDMTEVIFFPRGIPGFEQFRRYALFESEEIHPFQWLICVENDDLGFVVISPHFFLPDYRPRLYESDLRELHVDKNDTIALFAIVTLGKDPKDSTANLQGPLLINTTKKWANRSSWWTKNIHCGIRWFRAKLQKNG